LKKIDLGQTISMLATGEHVMNAGATTARRVAYEAAVAALLVGLYGCARERMYAHVESTPAAVISAEAAEEVPISPRSGRERAAEAARHCDGPSGDESAPGSRVVECAREGEYIR